MIESAPSATEPTTSCDSRKSPASKPSTLEPDPKVASHRVLRLQIEPVPKGRPRLGRSRVRTPAKTKRFERDLKALVLNEWKQEPFHGPIFVSATFYVTKPETVTRSNCCVKPDLDNLIKALFDALNGIVWIDDSQVVSVVTQKYYAPRGEIVLGITAPGGPDAEKAKRDYDRRRGRIQSASRKHGSHRSRPSWRNRALGHPKR